MNAAKSLTLVTLVGVSLMVSGCNAHRNIGGLVGGVADGNGGSQIGGGKGKLIATGIGSLLGLVTGSDLGSFMDDVNRNSGSITQLQLEQMKLRQKGSSTMVFPTGQSHSHGGGQQFQSGPSNSSYSCNVRNNYIVCNSP